jgi:hypothetical protein
MAADMSTRRPRWAAACDDRPFIRPIVRFVFAVDPDGILVEFVEPAVRAR